MRAWFQTWRRAPAIPSAATAGEWSAAPASPIPAASAMIPTFSMVE